MSVHIYPVDEEAEHVLTGLGEGCPCNPRVEWVDEITRKALSEPVVIHRSKDFRELIEEAEALPGIEKSNES